MTPVDGLDWLRAFKWLTAGIILAAMITAAVLLAYPNFQVHAKDVTIDFVQWDAIFTRPEEAGLGDVQLLGDPGDLFDRVVQLSYPANRLQVGGEGDCGESGPFRLEARSSTGGNITIYDKTRYFLEPSYQEDRGVYQLSGYEYSVASEKYTDHWAIADPENGVQGDLQILGTTHSLSVTLVSAKGCDVPTAEVYFQSETSLGFTADPTANIEIRRSPPDENQLRLLEFFARDLQPESNQIAYHADESDWPFGNFISPLIADSDFMIEVSSFKTLEYSDSEGVSHQIEPSVEFPDGDRWARSVLIYADYGSVDVNALSDHIRMAATIDPDRLLLFRGRPTWLKVEGPTGMYRIDDQTYELSGLPPVEIEATALKLSIGDSGEQRSLNVVGNAKNFKVGGKQKVLSQWDAEPPEFKGAVIAGLIAAIAGLLGVFIPFLVRWASAKTR